MVFLTFTIGVLNLCLGYVLAVKLGYGPPTLFAWAAPKVDRVAEAEVAAMLAEADTAPDLDAMLEDVSEDDWFDEPLEEQAGEVDVRDEDPSQVLEADAPEDWDLDEKFVETSILKLNIAMMKSGARVTEIDARLRNAQTHCDLELIQSCLRDLKEDCQTYLAEQSSAARTFHDRIGELGELSALGDEIELTNLEQAAQIETTLSNLDNMDFQSDLTAAAKRLLDEIDHLRVARHRLRDSQEEAFLAIARSENRLDKIEKRLYNDSLTKLPNRIGLETMLHDWWTSGKLRAHQMSAALFDVDRFTRVNEEHGPMIADAILHGIAQYLQQQCAKNDLVARFSGQRFFVMMVDTGPRTATKNVELIRQGIERISWVREEKEAVVTVGGAVTEVAVDDAEYDVFRRLLAAIKAAKQAGANRCFLHDGQVISPIESPNFGTDYIEIQI